MVRVFVGARVGVGGRGVEVLVGGIEVGWAIGWSTVPGFSGVADEPAPQAYATRDRRRMRRRMRFIP